MSFPGIPIDSLRATIIGSFGEDDDMGEVMICDEGLILEGYHKPDCIGLPWGELKRILEHPVVQAKLEESFLEETIGV